MTMRYVEAREGASLLKQELKAKFPGVTFSVRSEVYTGGSEISVQWADGPTVAQVERIAARYRGGTFDGQQDLYTSRPSRLNGATVQHLAHNVACTRRVTLGNLSRIAAKVARKYGVPCPRIVPATPEPYLDRQDRACDALVGNGIEDLWTAIMRRYQETAFPAPGTV